MRKGEGSRLSHRPRDRSSVPLLIWAAYVIFVVYGSLVPLNFTERPLHEAWRAYLGMPFLNLGVGARADWVANGVLYVPVALLSTYSLGLLMLRSPRSLVLILAGVFSASLAGGIEFLQLFFPPRTVSLNDIAAECAGSLFGLVLSGKFANWFGKLLSSFLESSQKLQQRLLEWYALAYLVFCFLPYDILLSWAEIVAKSDSLAVGVG